ncbi:MAG: peptidyl-alpha-hydroxyglycine alpha-amidating lyase family protein [Chloroflexota bacterium]
MRYGSGVYTYELLPRWARCPEGFSFLDVSGLAVDEDDNVYVLNRSEHPVIVFDREGNWLRSFGRGYFGRAHGACIASDGSVWCTDDRRHTVTRFSPSGEVLQVLGMRDQPSDSGYQEKGDWWANLLSVRRGAGPFNRPTGVAVAPSGEIYVSDGYGNARVHKFAPEGAILLSWGEPGSGPGQFLLPHDVALDGGGRVWVCDRENNRVQIFSPYGSYIDQWTGFLRPDGVFIDVEGVVYVADLGRRVSVFRQDGTLLARWGNEQGEPTLDSLFVAPHAIAVDSPGDIYVGDVSRTNRGIDRGVRTVQKFLRCRD